MKKLFYIKIALVSLMASALFSSCLKDNSRYVDFSADAPVVDFALVAVNNVKLQTATISAAAATNTINAEISAANSKDLTSPTAVTVSIDAASLTAAYGAAYTLLPASTYTVVGSLTTNVIPGISQRAAPTEPIVGTPAVLPTSLGAVSFNVNTAAVQALMTANPGVIYVLPLTITGAVGNGAVIDQFHTLYYKIVVGP
jgi:hypothetical protein